MKIIVKNTNSERQSPEVTIDTSTCHYPYAIREALQLALELDGYDKETINEVFNQTPVVCKQDLGGQDEAEQVTKECIFEDTTHGFMSAVSYLKQMDEKILTLIEPHEIVKHANRIWEKNLQAAEPAQEQGHFSYDNEGYTEAYYYLRHENKYLEVTESGKNVDMKTVVGNANKLWEQNNKNQ